MAISKAELDAIAKLVEEACGDWASLGFDKDEDGYLWAMGYAFGRETKQLREDRRFTRHGESSMMNNPSLRAERYLRMTSVTARELDLLELLETSEYEPLNAVREEYVLRMMAAWKDATLTREEKQVKLATLKEEFLQSIEAEKLRRAEVKRQQEEAARQREAEAEARRIYAAEMAAKAEEGRRIAAEAARKLNAEIRASLGEGFEDVRDNELKFWVNVNSIYSQLSARDAARWIRSAATFAREGWWEKGADVNQLVNMGVMDTWEADSYRAARGRDGRMAWDTSTQKTEYILSEVKKPPLWRVYRAVDAQQLRKGYSLFVARTPNMAQLELF